MFKLLKRNARLALKGSWGPAILITLTVILVSALLGVLEHIAINLSILEPLARNPTMEPTARGVAQFTRDLFTYQWAELAITAGFVLLTVLLIAPLTLGVTNWYYKLVHGEKPGYGDCFHFFESPRRFFRSIYYYLLVTVKSILWAIPFYALPGALFTISAYFLSAESLETAQQAAATVGVSLAAAMTLLVSVLFTMFINRYAAAPYLLCENPDRKARDAIKQSVRYTKGYRASWFLFGLSFIGWVLLTPLTLGVLTLFLSPYIGAGQALYARYIMEKGAAVADGDEDEETAARELFAGTAAEPAATPDPAEQPLPAEREPAPSNLTDEAPTQVIGKGPEPVSAAPAATPAAPPQPEGPTVPPTTPRPQRDDPLAPFRPPEERQQPTAPADPRPQPHTPPQDPGNGGHP